MRAAMSVDPPAGKATISWIGLLGKSCCAVAVPVSAATTAAATERHFANLSISYPPFVFQTHSSNRLNWRTPHGLPAEAAVAPKRQEQQLPAPAAPGRAGA